MADPLTWTAVQQIRAMLGAIRIADGYYTDIGLGAFVDSRDQIKNFTAPTTVVLVQEINTDETATGRSRTTLSGDMVVTVEYILPFSLTDNQERLAHCGRADIVRALKQSLRGEAFGVRDIKVITSLIESAPIDGVDVIVALVQARASLSESNPPA